MTERRMLAALRCHTNKYSHELAREVMSLVRLGECSPDGEYAPMDIMHSRFDEVKFDLGCRTVVAVYSWGRDCDLMESSSVSLIDADNFLKFYKEYKRRENLMYGCAEGPCTMFLIDEHSYREYVPYRRDRAAEMMGY